MGNPHRGDTDIDIDGVRYTLCYDLNALAKVMKRLGIRSLKEIASTESLDLGGIDDLIYILWAGLQRHHSELTEHDVGAMNWDLTEAASVLGEAIQSSVAHKQSNESSSSSNLKEGPQSDPLVLGTGTKSG
ncbi:MAG: hypothetical protein GWN01_09200 [Nitrosopumilaceae archaeon]|nr:hypothetical protein [Nitrosopumilaceae archaeon]NIU87786.1 hypothetical protein [Nitrosopumilaceae archaeon]NIV65169.1 hypothetical protein [Nitrosopumilaceae archaeon]NIX61684.1 hypothetical protein [Nitrosopumilaceae archaeon]